MKIIFNLVDHRVITICLTEKKFLMCSIMHKIINGFKVEGVFNLYICRRRRVQLRIYKRIHLDLNIQKILRFVHPENVL